ncbi:hypothetical protein [Evansella cellulosilytica]|uniref:Uncharacterized protein n=1 Tax=Evansella cellulosilytica (strain ATCC 21833 / DSM 2522 / FERM P-1141 / JCM 9156 / N-4) TaxID=649639 RepID=E6TW39_EVAC2|nr:hypothetical protein [Evansella cellulosilytica]ADU29862.1 hypothetical protein Bcell_1599 [Evansella cellulosilytica DSM 2522]
MGLIEALLGNPLLLILLIGALFSFFQRLGASNTEEQQQPPKRNTPQQEIDWEDIFRQEESKQEPAEKSSVNDVYTPDSYYNSEDELAKANSELQDRYEATKKRKQRARELEQVMKKDSPIFTEDITKQTNVGVSFSNMTREDAIKGIIWSEVLGKPKSKK